MRAKEIYDNLIESLGNQYNDETWIDSIKKDYNLTDNEWTPDCLFLITTSWGPWIISRQMDVWKKMKLNFPEVKDDIRNADQNFKGFPFGWQNNRVITLSKYLKQDSKSFKDIVEQLRSLNGIESRDLLAKISGAKQNKKTISCFIRDFLLKDTFPIDSRVSEMLSCLGLPNNEDQIIKLCKMDKVDSRILDRMLYLQYDNCPTQANNKCEKCKIKDYCWKYILR